jgi:hypothetical protein
MNATYLFDSAKCLLLWFNRKNGGREVNPPPWNIFHTDSNELLFDLIVLILTEILVDYDHI